MKIDTPIPERMALLPRDHRGYPIPWIVYRDQDDRPHFTINDHIKRAHVIKGDGCGICGQRLLRGRWFIGGPAAAFHPHGAYIDPPMHDECAHFALKVCPYLAVRSFTGVIGTKTLPNLHDHIILEDPTMIDGRPEVFVAVMTVRQSLINGGEYVKPGQPYRKLEYWRHGVELSRQEAQAAIRTAMEKEQA